MSLGSVMKVRIFILAQQRRPMVDLVDAVDELSPPFARRRPGCRLAGLRVRPRPVGFPNPVGVSPAETDQVVVGLREVDEDPGQELEGEVVSRS